MPVTFPGDMKLKVHVHIKEDQDTTLTEFADFRAHAGGERMKFSGRMQDCAIKHFKTFAII